MNLLPLIAPIASMLQSKKAVVLVFAIIGAIVMNYLGRVTGEEALAFIKWVVSVWLVAQGLVDGAQHVGNGLAAGGSVTNTTTTSATVNPPSDPAH